MKTFYILTKANVDSGMVVACHMVNLPYESSSYYPTAPDGFAWYLVHSDDNPAECNDLIGIWFENLSATNGATKVVPQPVYGGSALMVPTEAEVKAAGQDAIDQMNVVWITVMSLGAPKQLGITRWTNTYRWIMGATACTLAIVRSTDSFWTDTRKAMAFLQMKELLKNVKFWYHNHDDAIWTAYVSDFSSFVGDSGTEIRAYFKLDLVGGSLHSFGADAAASTAWDGTGGTIDVMFGADVLPGDL